MEIGSIGSSLARPGNSIKLRESDQGSTAPTPSELNATRTPESEQNGASPAAPQRSNEAQVDEPAQSTNDSESTRPSPDINASASISQDRSLVLSSASTLAERPSISPVSNDNENAAQALEDRINNILGEPSEVERLVDELV